MMKLLKLAVGLFLVLPSCKQMTNDTQYSGYEIQKVTVAFSGYACEGECPFQALAIDSTLKINYYGGLFAPLKGYFEGNVSKVLWDSVQLYFSKFITVGIDSTDLTRTDHPDVEFQINTKTQNYIFNKNTGKLSDADKAILYWFVNINKQLNTLKPTDSLPFQTSIQYRKIQNRN
jgi:hypothetical protein